METDTSWKTYLGASFALTAVVFALWSLYLWVSKHHATIVAQTPGLQEDGGRRIIRKDGTLLG